MCGRGCTAVGGWIVKKGLLTCCNLKCRSFLIKKFRLHSFFYRDTLQRHIPICSFLFISELQTWCKFNCRKAIRDKHVGLPLHGVIYVAHLAVCCWGFGYFYGLRLGVRYRAWIVGTKYALSLLYFMFSVPWDMVI